MKGSPEKCWELCVRESIPANFDQVLEEYTKEGYRVICICYKMLDYSDLNEERDVIESDCHFLGLFIM